MATNINFRSVNDVATAESLTDGDKVLLNSGGVAKQIDASKIGGSGGGVLVVYTTVELEAMGSEEMQISAYRDPEMTQLYTYAELKEYLLKGMCIYMAVTNEGAVEMQQAIYPIALIDFEAYRIICAFMHNGSTAASLYLLGSDAAMG